MDWDDPEVERRRSLSPAQAEAEAEVLVAAALESRSETLDLSFLEISALPAAIARMEWLSSLRCKKTQVRDLSPLSGLRELTSLSCFDSKVSDLSPISEISSLATLDCSFNPISDLSPLSDLANLSSLAIRAAFIRDLSPLQNLRKLVFLNCSETGVEDLSPLKSITTLDALDCSETWLKDFSPLSGLTALTYLFCSETLVDDLSPLSGLNALETLIFSRTKVHDLSPISGLSALKELIFRRTHVSDLSPLSGLTALTSLNCRSTRVSDLSPLTGLLALSSINCSQTQVDDLSPLADLPTLTSLNCSETQVSNLLPLSGLPALASLDCSETHVSDLSPLSGLPALASIDCQTTQVSDLSPLAGLPKLATLSCSHTQVSDLMSVLQCRSITHLVAYNLPRVAIPAEILSRKDTDDNCLPRLRAYWDNLEGGAEPFRQHKLFLLGNGTVGKTQVARVLMEKPYDDNVPSTHGIQILSHTLPAPADLRHDTAGEAFTAKIWDFGGQDIYHGTHALFLKTRAIFLTCWEGDSERTREHVIDGVPYRNRKLAYWRDYVLQFAGPNAEVILVQTKNDKPGSAADAAEIEARYPDCPSCSTSAQDEEGFNRLKRLIAEAVGRIEAPALPIIPTSQRRVIDAVTAARDGGIRTMDREAFAALCQECGLIGAPEHMLHFLHHAGEVFHVEGRFGNQIIIDQRWALDAIYAVFDRDQCWQRIKAERGRFTLTLLAPTVWQDFSPEDCDNLLAMMLQCGMAFRYVEGEAGQHDAVYIAPDLLPERGEMSVSRWISRYWDDAAPMQRRAVAFDLLHDGLMREIMREIGRDAGLHAVYWKNGLLFFDDATGGLAMIEANWPDPEGWAGEIVVSTQRKGAADLASRLEAHVLAVGEKLGLSPGAMQPLPRSRNKDRPAMAEAPTAPVNDHRRLRMHLRETLDEKHSPLRPAAARPLRPVCYVSYTRQDQRKAIQGDEQLVDKLRREAKERQIDLITYEDHLRAGDTITGFTDEIAKAHMVAALIGPHYLRRPHCYHELERCWAEAALDEVRFKRKMRPFPVDGAVLYPDTSTGEERIAKGVAAYWQSEFERCHALRDRDLEEELIAKLGKRWATETPPILRALQDMVANYRDFDDFRSQLFADLEALRYKPDHDSDA